MKKRMLMMLLALMMIVSMLPFSAMAAEKICLHKKTYIEKEDGDCLHQGVINIICKNCGYVKSTQQGFAPHSYDTNSKCTVCGTVCSHTYGEKVTVAATCTKSGSVTQTCTECGYKKTVKGLKALGHKFTESFEAQAATCTVDGFEAHKECSVCGEKNEDYIVIEALGHDIETVTDIAATCNKSGKLVQACKNEGCEFEVTETRKKLDHSYVDMDAKDPTCTEAGYTAYEKCSKCGKEVGKTSIAATGHTYVNGQCVDCGVAAPDYTGSGKPIKNCKHPSKSTYTTSPDCTVVGYVVVTCDVCHKEISREILPATGHTLKSVKQDPTCTEDGFVMEICEVCNTPISGIAMEALGHNHVNGICTRCGGADPQKYTNDLQDFFLVG